MLAGPGTPRDPKYDVVANWVAIQPFWTFYARLDAEFQPRARQIGPTPSISTVFVYFGAKYAKKTAKSRTNQHVFDRWQAALEGLAPAMLKTFKNMNIFSTDGKLPWRTWLAAKHAENASKMLKKSKK